MYNRARRSAQYVFLVIKLIKIVKVCGGRMLIAPGAATQERVTIHALSDLKLCSK